MPFENIPLEDKIRIIDAAVERMEREKQGDKPLGDLEISQAILDQAALQEQEFGDPTEALESLIVQRHAIEAFKQRTEMILGNYDFPNPRDRETQYTLILSGFVAAAMCSVKDSRGGSLGNTVDEIAKRCVKAEAGSKKQSKLIDELQDELDRVKAYFAEGGPGRRGNH